VAYEVTTLYREKLDEQNAVRVVLDKAGVLPKSEFVYQTEEFQWAFGQDPATGQLVMAVATLDGQTGLFRSRPA